MLLRGPVLHCHCHCAKAVDVNVNVEGYDGEVKWSGVRGFTEYINCNCNYYT